MTQEGQIVSHLCVRMICDNKILHRGGTLKLHGSVRANTWFCIWFGFYLFYTLFGETVHDRYPTGCEKIRLLEAQQQVPWRTQKAWNTKEEHVQTHMG